MSYKHMLIFDLLMFLKIKYLFLFLPIFLLASGGFDNGTSAGKAKWDISLTWNPFKYFEQGQSYIVLGYGITEKIDIHGYYSNKHSGKNNYYLGLFYQFIDHPKLDLSTAIGVRKYVDDPKTHLFTPQLLYTIKINNKINLGGSFVNVLNTNSNFREGTTTDIFLMTNLYENDKYKINFTTGFFKPVLWKPQNGEWHPTYSIDINIK
jgi:hypothetical protein